MFTTIGQYPGFGLIIGVLIDRKFQEAGRSPK